MHDSAVFAWMLFAAQAVLQLVFIVRALLRPHREPASRFAWVLVIALAPVVGVLAYVLFGEVNLGRGRVARLHAALKTLPPAEGIAGPSAEAAVPERYIPLFRVGHSVNGFLPVAGNRAALTPDSAAAVEAMVADIDAARHSVHVLFYIWLADGSGLKVMAAVKRAAARGVVCRVIVDDLGSRALVRSVHWRDMAEAGVRLAAALPVGNPLLRPLKGRIDMRNHRKIVVVDNRIAYCGSQNCADAAFAVKAKYAPWVDVLARFEGPIVRQKQHLFAANWMSQVDEDLSPLFAEPLPGDAPGFVAQAIGSGAGVRYSAMPETFVALMNAARRELVITTPYYVPDEPIQAALCGSARRGVSTTIVFPARNDSWIVAAASRSYYRDLIEAGVQIREYEGGLLHAKTLTLDGEVTLIGSANIDRRSFELNAENNILLYDPAFTVQMRARQQVFMDAATAVTRAEVEAYGRPRQLWNNAIAMLGPVL
ncbi:cardiolipin synthase [Xanthobacter tagetidis]|uniref:Cardiolipin synthase n=1 Tax=Xanthobacter tagetidis TaxID=60216 RepID=A0A3L7AN15_9HYPH|nr:cardiolipin synthase [Xanthobacter tagetidis]MBB6307457.1 cardiolipin synthase [Xanthobacter tagetidis]RLP81040.1 cardiolipin synthase [Xanthobacter tagetidis]